MIKSILLALLISLPLGPLWAQEGSQELPRLDLTVQTPHIQGLQNVRLLGVEADSIEAARFALPQVLEQAGLTRESLHQVTVVASDSAGSQPEASEQAVQKLAEEFKGKVENVAVPRKTFGDWFKDHKVRISLVAWVYTLTTGSQYAQLTLSPQPLEHSVALATAMTLAGTLAVVDWNTPRIMNLIRNTSSPVKSVISYISTAAQSEKIQKKVEEKLVSAWQFTKNSAINFGLFSVFKIVVYAYSQGDMQSLELLRSTFVETLRPDVLRNSGEMALLATVVSFPTTKVIFGYNQRLLNEAGSDDVAKKEAWDKTMFAVSSALTYRAVMFGAKIISASLGWPGLNTMANVGLGAMMTASIGRLVWDSRKAKAAQSCAVSLN